jgi:methionine aminopeptidase
MVTNNEIYQSGIDLQKKQVAEVERMITEKEKELAKINKAHSYADVRKDESEIFQESAQSLAAKKTSLETEIRNQKVRLLKMKETLISILKTANGGE